MARQITLKIDDDRCQSCPDCLASRACAVRAIFRIDPDEPPFLEVNRCRDCRVCLPACPFGAVVDSR